MFFFIHKNSYYLKCLLYYLRQIFNVLFLIYTFYFKKKLIINDHMDKKNTLWDVVM